MIDRATLAAIPDPVLDRPDAVKRGIEHSVAYLGSDPALRSLEADIYWPKWDSPWWHMLVLHELGESRQIPAPAVSSMVAGLDALPLHVFPIRPEECPPHLDVGRDGTCHCALGCMAQVLAACGVDVDAALPWVPPWFARYQMADGGLNCDEQAYLVEGECPSSMVGTIAPFEARLGSSEPFVDRAAQFLIDRALTRGSSTVHNAEERDAARAWPQPTFPRFYHYDVLRGLAALVAWAETPAAAGEQPLPAAAIADAVAALVAQAPDGVVRVGRRAWGGKTTRVVTPERGPVVRAPASPFPLLEAVSVVGEPSEALTRQWTRARHALIRLRDAGRIAA